MKNKVCVWGWIGKILIPSLLTVILYIVAIYIIIIPALKNNFINQKKEMLSRLVESVWSLVDDYHTRSSVGFLTEEEAKERVLSRIRSIRYGTGNKDYFWVNNMDFKLVMHPYRPDMEGLDLYDYMDSKGNHLFVDFVNIAKDNGAGFSTYWWQLHEDQNKIVPKISYIKYFEPWKWVIGTGVYIENLNEALHKIAAKLVFVTSVIFVIVLILSVIININSLIIQQRQLDSQKQLEESELRFRQIVEKSPFPMFLINNDFKIDYINPKFEEIFGYCASEINTIDDFLTTCFAHTTSIEEAKRFWMEKNRESLDEKILSLFCKSKIQKKVLFKKVILKNGKMFVYAVDITKVKQVEQELARYAEDLKRSNTELEKYAFVASHDLQEPLRILSTYLDYLYDQEKDSLNEKSLNYIARALQNAERMRCLIQDLLDLSMINKQSLKIENVDLNDIIKNVKNNFKSLFEERKVEFQSQQLPCVKADKSKIQILFEHLIKNAVKFNESSKPEIHITCKKINGTYTFYIKDNGIGIDRQYYSRIFEMFERLKVNGQFTSTGAGLAISKKIVESHGGRIWVESELEYGSVFIFSLPA